MRSLRPADPGVATMFLPGMVDDGVAVVVGRLERAARKRERGRQRKEPGPEAIGSYARCLRLALL